METALPNFPAHTAYARSARRPALVLTAAQKLLLPLGPVLFDWLFWLEGAGLNMLVYTVFVVGAQLYLLPRHAAARRSGYFWLAVGGSVGSGVLVAVYGSGAAVLACWTSLALLLGYVNQPHLKLVLYAVLTALGSAGQAGWLVLRGLRLPESPSGNVRAGWFYARLLLLPVVVLVVFHFLFVLANPVYSRLSGEALAVLGEWLAKLIPDISIGHLLFIILGFSITAGLLVVVPMHFLADHESHFGEFVRRQRDRVASFGVRRPDFRTKRFRALDLRKEFLAAAAVFGLVNLLLLVVNAIDVHWLWFGFAPAPGFDLTQFVHEGTYVLIFSILLAMGIVLWFFRRNLNFYAPGLPWLRWGATVWVVQNAVLAGSVGVRNYYYVLHTGLAYKRIGVCFFLLLTLFGLATVLLKIWQRRSAYSLVRLNALAAYAVLLLLAAGNWEIWMARYNLNPRFHTVDAGFLLAMPGRVLPTVLARRAVFDQVPALVADDGSGYYHGLSPIYAQQQLDEAVRRWQFQQKDRDWQSLCWADWQAYESLKNK